ncbi:MAG: hypothetical protein JRG89_19875 [Deltaproteobacteria bacterium]|nr:hypothetical protein [Deltaproteobacteria bacterium]
MTAATHAVADSGTPSIEWLCDGLERDRSHVMVLCVTPVASSADAPVLLARRYASSFDVVSASLAGLEPDAALARIFEDREASNSVDLEARLLQRIEALLARGSAMVLALPDATSIPAATLRRLGGLASASKQGLRLALFADCTADSVDARAAGLVRDLGVGVEKVVVGLHPGQGTGSSASAAGDPTLEVHPAAWQGPPRIEHEPLPWWARGRAIRLRTQGRHRHDQLASWLGIGFIAALLVVWWLRPDFASLVTQSADPVVAELNSSPAVVVAEALPHVLDTPSATDELPPVSLPEPTSIAESEPTPDEPSPSQAVATNSAGPALQQPEIPPTPVTLARPISVNMNAIPWADVELDGRSIGTTPLADVPIEPGRHHMVVRFPDGLVLERTVEIDRFNRYLRFP